MERMIYHYASRDGTVDRCVDFVRSLATFSQTLLILRKILILIVRVLISTNLFIEVLNINSFLGYMYFQINSVYCCNNSCSNRKPIGPDEEIRETIQIKPRRAGRREIIACFQCKQICDVTGVVEIDVVGDNKS